MKTDAWTPEEDRVLLESHAEASGDAVMRWYLCARPDEHRWIRPSRC